MVANAPHPKFTPLPTRPPESLLVFSLAAVALLFAPACDGWERWSQRQQPIAAKCSINVVGKGLKDMETDYLPHVITCENGAADFEALKAQAVAARSYAYYVTRNGGSIKDGQSNQVYTCSAKPKQKHYDAVKATAGQVLRYQNTVICAFYVAGAKPSDTTGCAATSSDWDGTNTERYVTYNQGKSGNGITQSTLGWVSQSNIYNRGCKSQNGANCLSKAGRSYLEILRFYYGSDIELHQTWGSCVTPTPDQGVPPTPDQGVPPTPDQGTPPAPDQGTPPTPDQGQPSPDAGAPKADVGNGSRPDMAWPGFPDAASSHGQSAPQLSGGCALGGGGEGAAGGGFVLLGLLLALVLRRR